MEGEDGVADEDAEIMDELRIFLKIKNLEFEFDFWQKFILGNGVDRLIEVKGDRHEYLNKASEHFLVINGPPELLHDYFDELSRSVLKHDSRHISETAVIESHLEQGGCLDLEAAETIQQNLYIKNYFLRGNILPFTHCQGGRQKDANHIMVEDFIADVKQLLKYRIQDEGCSLRLVIDDDCQYDGPNLRLFREREATQGDTERPPLHTAFSQ